MACTQLWMKNCPARLRFTGGARGNRIEEVLIKVFAEDRTPIFTGV